MIVLPKLIIIRGNSGSGKTTLAREIHNHLPRNTLLISQDTVRRDMLRVKDGENTLGLPLFEDLLHYGYRNCDYVILEGILNAEWYLPLFRQAEELFGEEIFAYYFDISFEETLMRHKQQNISSFGEKQMHSWWKEKDYINFISETKFSSRTTLRQETKKIMKDISYVNNH